MYTNIYIYIYILYVCVCVCLCVCVCVGVWILVHPSQTSFSRRNFVIFTLGSYPSNMKPLQIIKPAGSFITKGYLLLGTQRQNHVIKDDYIQYIVSISISIKSAFAGQ